MRYPVALVGLASLAAMTVVTAQEVCTAGIARPIDGEVEFAEYLGLLAAGWAAICAFGCIKKRDDILATLLRRDTLTCTAAEECLSYKHDPFCFNRADWTFHTADGTTGNFKTGVYTLPDGQVGNMYYGPYPSETAPSSTPVAAPSATPTGASVSVITSVVLVSSTGAGAPAESSPGATAAGAGGSGPVTSVSPTSTPKSGEAPRSLGAGATLEWLAIALFGLMFLVY